MKDPSPPAGFDKASAQAALGIEQMHEERRALRAAYEELLPAYIRAQRALEEHEAQWAPLLAWLDAQTAAPVEGGNCLTCPHCHREHPAAGRFCTACGAQLQPAAPPPTPEQSAQTQRFALTSAIALLEGQLAEAKLRLSEYVQDLRVGERPEHPDTVRYFRQERLTGWLARQIQFYQQALASLEEDRSPDQRG